MSEERLEELKGVLKSWEVWNDWNESQRKVLKDLVYYLERVQELEELIAAYHTELSIKDNANKRIKKKNKRYREA